MDATEENKKAPGNGNGFGEKTGAGRLAGPGTAEESAPLKPRYAEPIAKFDEEGNDPGQDERKSDLLGSCAHKCHLTPKKGLIYLIVSGLIIFILLIVLLSLLSLWPSSYSTNLCQTFECHFLSAQVITKDPLESQADISMETEHLVNLNGES